MNRAFLILLGSFVTMTVPAFAQQIEPQSPEDVTAVQVAQVFTSEEWIDALITPVKADPLRGLAAVPGTPIRVQFDFGSATLSDSSKATLDTLGRALESNQLSPFEFRINGHTDAVGERPFNQSLSESRAHSVRDYLATHFAIDRDRLTSFGLGETVLLNEDDPAADENRRVEIMNVGPAG